MANNEIEIAYKVADIMNLLDIPFTEGNKETPKRIAKMLSNELFLNRNDAHMDELNEQMTLFPCEDGNVHGKIICRDIPFSSMCEHHWLPFMGKVTITYIPSDKIIGLSKIPRVVKYFSKRPQLQERLTKDIGDYLYNILHPFYLSVEITATHTCVMCRGAESDCVTETSKVWK